jgi:hypothetical protein
MLAESKLRRATREDLTALRSRIFSELARRDVEGETPSPVRRKRKRGNGRRLSLERVKCGKTRCKRCGADGAGHGPYYYIYLTNPKTGQRTSRYIGKATNITEEIRQEFGSEIEKLEEKRRDTHRSCEGDEDDRSSHPV